MSTKHRTQGDGSPCTVPTCKISGTSVILNWLCWKLGRCQGMRIKARHVNLLEGVGSHQQHSQFPTPRPRGRPVTKGRGYGHGRQPISTPLISSQPVSEWEVILWCLHPWRFYERRKDLSGHCTSLRRRRGRCCQRVTRCHRGCRFASRKRRRWRRLGER